MTRKETKQCIAVMQAYADGKQLELFDKYKNEWVDVVDPTWNWYNNVYRIKPESSYRPFRNVEECWKEMLKHQPFGIVSNKNRKEYMSFKFLADEGCDFCGYEDETFTSLFSGIQFVDGTPFGVKAEQ